MIIPNGYIQFKITIQIKSNKSLFIKGDFYDIIIIRIKNAFNKTENLRCITHKRTRRFDILSSFFLFLLLWYRYPSNLSKI